MIGSEDERVNQDVGTPREGPRTGGRASAEEVAGAGRATSYWHYVSCRCGWSRSVQINAKPTTIRKSFRIVGDHFAAHREDAIASLRDRETAK